MNYISSFYNTAITHETKHNILLNPLGHINCEHLANTFFKPVRYLFNGTDLRIEQNGDNIRLAKTDPIELKTKKLIISIILLAPCIILGTFFKAISLCNSRVRERFRYAVIHNTPIERTELYLTSDRTADRLSLEDPFLRKIKNLIIHGNDEPIGPEDELDFKNIAIAERLVLHNCWLLGTLGAYDGKAHMRKTLNKLEPGAALRLQGFEGSVKSVFNGSNSDVSRIPDTGRTEFFTKQHCPQRRKLVKVSTDVYSNPKDLYQKGDIGYQTFITKPDGEIGESEFIHASKEEFYEHLASELPHQLERDKAALHHFFSYTPHGVVSHVFSRSHISERVVRNLDSALNQKLPRKHWYSFEKRPRMFVYFDAPAAPTHGAEATDPN